ADDVRLRRRFLRRREIVSARRTRSGEHQRSQRRGEATQAGGPDHGWAVPVGRARSGWIVYPAAHDTRSARAETRRLTSSKPGLGRFDGLHPHRVVGRRIVVSRRTVSTQEDARRLARSLGEDAHGLVVTTLEQTGGRGTRGRTWWSPPGTSLALSF